MNGSRYCRQSVAQSGRASALGAEGQGFKSLHSDHFLGQCSSVIERHISNVRVGGLIPSIGSKIL